MDCVKEEDMKEKGESDKIGRLFSNYTWTIINLGPSHKPKRHRTRLKWKILYSLIVRTEYNIWICHMYKLYVCNYVHIIFTYIVMHVLNF